MRTARLHSILLEAEGPLLAVFRDRLGGSWLGTAIEREDHGERFVCVPVSEKRLSAFRHGEIDLRSALVEPEENEHAQITLPFHGAEAADLELDLITPPQDWLPDEGFYLTTFIEPVAAEYREMASLATVENRPILRLNLSPPGGEHAVDVDQLGEALVLFQNGLRHAHTLVTKALSFNERKAQAAPEYHLFEALAFAPNSFEVHMRAKAVPTLFGDTPHIRALQKLDEITSVVDDTDAAVAVAQNNRGHFVSAVTALMRFVSTNGIPFSYAWVQPNTPRVHPVSIRPESARSLYEALVSKKELLREPKSLVGVFDKIHKSKGTWVLETNEGEKFTGKIAKAAEVNLSGITIGSITYAVECVDVAAETTGSGRRSSTLEMVNQPREIPAAQ